MAAVIIVVIVAAISAGLRCGRCKKRSIVVELR